MLAELRKEFEITSNEINTYLGLQIERLADGSIFLHQEAYTKKILQRFRMENANAVAMPADQNHQLCVEAHKSGYKEKSEFPYRQAVESLMYLSVGTRPDITFAVNKVSQYLEKPNKIHWNAVKRIFKYLKGTTKYGIHYLTQQNNHIKPFSDADYAGDTETRKSTTGFVLKLGDSAIAWGSTRQRTVALSTTEAEYIAASQTIKEIIWMKSLINDLVLFKNITTTLYVDNLSAIKLIKNPEFHRRSKHIDVRYHFIRDKFKEKEFLLQHIASEDQQADLLTKPLEEQYLKYKEID